MNYWVMSEQTDSGHFTYTDGKLNEPAVGEAHMPDSMGVAHFEVEYDSHYQDIALIT